MMEYTYQISLGGFDSGALSADAAPADALRRAYELTKPGDVIIGWNTRADYYRDILDIVHSSGKRCWLWLPVFSELPAGCDADYSIGFDGKPQRGLSVMPGEDFRFACPSSPRNIETAYQIYIKHFSELPFDGIFLDKIRHASFAGGLTDGFGCFCETCRENYAKRGVDLNEAAALIKSNLAAMLPHAPKLSEQGTSGVYRFKNPLADNFYKAKTNIITSAVTELSEKFRALGLLTALDVYPPALAYFVGPDIPALSRQAEFVKPMCYRITRAPAGLPYELNGLQQAFAPYGVDIKAALQKIWQTEDLCSGGCLKSQLRELKNSIGKKLRPGFEINVVPGICDSGTEYVRKTAALLNEAGVNQAVLSWNLLAGTGENLKALNE